MTKDEEGMNGSKSAIFILLMAAFALPGVAHAEDAVEELKVCARIADQDARLTCYDNLGERVLREGPADSATSTNAQPLPDDVGESKAIQYVGLITSCKKGRSGDWYFFFDNGQVWKEVSNRNLRFKECNANATITRDTFGYKMQMDGVKKTIRVRRQK